MNIIELAREAGIPVETDWAGRPSTLVLKDGGTYLRGIDDLERLAALVRAAALEEAAGVCDVPAMYEDWEILGGAEGKELCNSLAATIRSLKEKT